MPLVFNFESPKNDYFFLSDPRSLIFSLFEDPLKKSKIKVATLFYCLNTTEKL